MVTRRRFLTGTAALGAAAAISSMERQAMAGANDTVVLALIGVGGRGSDHARGFAKLPKVRFKYVCDVDSNRGGSTMLELEKLQGSPAQRVTDMRQVLDDKEVDGVIIATPEHWHALASVWACQAGKDVYVEKNLALSIWEGRKMVEAARKYKRIVQCGFQNRSAPYGESAREYIKSGKLGKVVLVKVYNLLNGAAWKPQNDSDTPAGLDWDRWLGPAARVPYNPSRHRGWYDWYDYCGGAYSGDASHQLDLARMVLGDPPAPRFTYGTGGNYAFGSQRPTPELQVVTYDYPDFTMTCESATFPPYMRKSNQEERVGKKFPYWPQNNERIEIYGTKQLMYLGRHGMGWQVMESEGRVVAEDKGYFPDKWHQPNFIECIRTRKLPNADVEQAQQSATLVHLANIAYRVGKARLEYDGAKEAFVGNDAANKLTRSEMREGYRIGDEV